MMIKSCRRISVVIRALNEEEYIGILLEKLRMQQVIGTDIEIIVVDSGSTDSTIKIVKSHKVKLIEIPKEQFNYSYSLNLGIKQTRSNLIVILSAHAIPCQNNWLEKMISNFGNNKVAGVYCRQIPWPDADLYEILRLKKMFGENPRSFNKETSLANMNFSNAASCIRRSIWEKHPFTMPAAEDREWAYWAVRHGYTIVYDPEVQVYHSHNESCRKHAQRMVTLEKALDFQLGRQRNIIMTMRQAVGLAIRNIISVLSENCFAGKRTTYIIKGLCRAFWYLLEFCRFNS